MVKAQRGSCLSSFDEETLVATPDAQAGLQTSQPQINDAHAQFDRTLAMFSHIYIYVHINLYIHCLGV